MVLALISFLIPINFELERKEERKNGFVSVRRRKKSCDTHEHKNKEKRGIYFIEMAATIQNA